MKTVIIIRDRLDEHLSSVVSAVSDSMKVIRGNEDVSSIIYMDPPDLVIIDGSYLKEHGSRIVEEFRSNTIFGHLPIVAVYTKDDLEDAAFADAPIDDFIILDSPEIEIGRRIEFVAKRAVRDMDTNPLTRMPGNESVIRFIQRMLDEGKEAAVAWADIDNFKPYNDRYGFASGDEVITATGRVIANAVKEVDHKDLFVGHVGGDDFVFVCPVAQVKMLCEEIISRFDMVIKNFYSDEDVKQRGIVSKTRSGETTTFPLMTISIAVVLNEKRHYKHYGEASRDATEIKAYVKGLEGSNYMIDRRGKPR